MRFGLRFDGDGGEILAAGGGVDAAIAGLLAIVHESMRAGTWARLKVCYADDCIWAFYDHSRNRSATWCRMEECGNREKARAYRRTPAGRFQARPIAWIVQASDSRKARLSTDTETKLWGGETDKAVDNFPVSGHPIPAPVIHWLGRIKGAAARVNAELGKLDGDLAERIAAAGDAVAAGEHDDQFPVDVFQTGSGTSSNMNANEVLANLAGDGAHPNDHVNMGQSSNDVFPSAVHLAALGEVSDDLLPALDGLAATLDAKADEFADHVKSGRTHLMDAVPVTLGQEFAGFASQIRLGAARVRDTLGRVGQIPLGGTATGTGDQHPRRVRRSGCARSSREATGLEISAPDDRFEAQANRDALVELSGALKVVAVSMIKIANDLALMGSGPRAGPRRDPAAGAAEGLLDHARQGQPGDPRGRDPGRRPGDRQRRRDHARRHPGPVRAQRARAADRPQPARLDQAARRRRPPARRAMRQRHRAERGDAPAPRRVDASGRDRAQPAHRLRRRRRDRQGGGEPPAARCARSRPSGGSTSRCSSRPSTSVKMARPHE